MIELEDIRKAAQRISPYVQHTPLLRSRSLSEGCGAEVFLKCENFQRVGAFKFRGACNTVLSLDESISVVATHSSGNHGAAVALAAKERGLKSFIVMPSNAVPLKKQNVQRCGGIVVDCDPGMAPRERALADLQQQWNAEVIHPFDDYRIMAGQGTVALELLAQAPDLDVLLIPIGGGGLISGCSVAIKSLNPNIEVIGVEPLEADDTKQSVDAGHRVVTDDSSTIADGLRAIVGELTFPIIQRYVDDVVTVTEDEILKATREALNELKLVIEPSAATVIAAAKNMESIRGKRVGLVVTGGNADLAALSS